MRPYFQILDQAIGVLHTLHAALDEARKRRSDSFIIVLLALSGAGCVQAAGIRRLVLSGLHSAALPLARTFLETLQVALVAAYDEAFAQAYHEADELDREQKFWRENISRGELLEKIKRIERQIGYEDLHPWRQGMLRWLSSSVHPCFLAAVFHTTALDLDVPEHFTVSATPQPDALSLKTIAVIVFAILHFVEVLLDPVIKRLDSAMQPLCKPDPSNLAEVSFVHSSWVFSTLLRAHYEEIYDM